MKVCYEIAMSIGNSLDLKKMLEESMAAYLRNLDCSAGMILERIAPAGGGHRFDPVYTTAQNPEGKSTLRAATRHIPDNTDDTRLRIFFDTLPIKGLADGNAFHIQALPDFGLLVLVKNGQDLDFSVLHSLKPLNEKLAKACIACRRTEKTEHPGKLELMGVLAGDIAHDFNDQLTTILGNIELVQTALQPEEPGYACLSEAKKACVRAKLLTNQFLTFSQGNPPVKKPGSIEKLIDNLRPLAVAGSNVMLETDIPGNLRHVDFDKDQMDQALSNLIANSIENLPRGGTIKIHARDIVVDAAMASSTPSLDRGNYVRISIRNQGVGESEANSDKIFGPSFSTGWEGARKSMVLGLFIARSIVKKHGGDILLESQNPLGTTFHVYLPISEKPVPKEASPETAVENGAGESILVLDDEKMIRDLSEQMLTHLGYQVACAKDGDEAVEMFKIAKKSGNPFDVVILDLTINGGQGGLETLNKLIAFDPAVKAIVSSGYINDPVLLQYKAHGFSGRITKPYSMAEVQRIVAEVVGRPGKQPPFDLDSPRPAGATSAR